MFYVSSAIDVLALIGVYQVFRWGMTLSEMLAKSKRDNPPTP